MDDREDFDAVSGLSIDDARGTFHDLPDLRLANFGDHAPGIGERCQLRCARKDALDHPRPDDGHRR